MKFLVSQTTPRQLDWLVSEIENALWEKYDLAVESESDPLPYRPSEFLRDYQFCEKFSPSQNWEQGGAIIAHMMKQNCFNVSSWGDSVEIEYCDKSVNTSTQTGPTLLIAAMRCYVESHLGSEVEIPGDLK